MNIEPNKALGDAIRIVSDDINETKQFDLSRCIIVFNYC
jgi:hypothetical protein